MSPARFCALVLPLILFFAGATPAWANPLEPSRDINTYALFAYDSLVWKGGADLTGSGGGDWGHIYNGNIGVNLSSAAAGLGAGNFSLDFATSNRGIMSPGFQAVADSVRADAAGVFSYLFANTLNASFAATVNNPNPSTAKGEYPFTTPIIAVGSLPTLPFTPQATLAAFQAAAGANYVAPFTVAAGTTITLDPTKYYGGIDVRDGATVKLGDASYRVWDFTAIGKNVAFQVTDKSVLNVDVHFNPNDNFRFGIGTNAGAQLNIGAQTPTYDNGGPSRVTNFSHDAIIYAQYFAPSGWLDLGGGNELYGRYWAEVISGDPNNNVTYESPPPSVPEPSTLLLLGSGLAGLMTWRWRHAKSA